jgi:predicted  nucleic acid-binding Zn-ribbon protein
MTDMPVYVKINEYRDVLEVVQVLKKKLAEARDTLEQIQQLRNEEEAELESWKAGLIDIEQKVSHLDSSLFEPHSM